MDDNKEPKYVRDLFLELNERVEEVEVEGSAAATIRLPQALLDRIDGSAKRYGMSRSLYLRKLLSSAQDEIDDSVIGREGGEIAVFSRHAHGLAPVPEEVAVPEVKD